MSKLRIAPDLVLPADAVTQTFLVVGKRGSGKSNTAARLVEQMYHAKLPFVVLDPVDTWWGLKASKDGERGLDVYVFGGAHQDLPLEAGERSGTLIADVLCEHRIPMVLSVKHLSGRERSTFMVAFAKRLFQKWGGGPLHVVLEEAHELAPQNVQTSREGEQEMLGAFKRLWKLGRASGIGGTAVTQRPASLSKDITTQSEILVAHRTIGPQDVKAIGEWVKYHGERLDILAELPTLPTGEAFVWAPEFPEGKPIGLQRTKILLRDTYDSASTPKVGEKRVEPKELAAVDIERLREQMSETMERAKADDPKELRKEIAELKRSLAANSGIAGNEVKRLLDQEYERGVSEGSRRRAMAARATATWLSQQVSLLEETATRAKGISSRLLDELEAPQVASAPTYPSGRPRVHVVQTPLPSPRAPKAESNGDVTGVEQRILNTLKALEEMGVTPVDKPTAAALVGYHPNAKSYANALGSLRSAGRIDYPSGGQVALTEEGRAIAVSQLSISSVDELHQLWFERLGNVAQRILEPVIDAYVHGKGGLQAVDTDWLAKQAGYHPNAKSFANMKGRLRTLGLIDYPSSGKVMATKVLFPEGLY